MRNLDNFLILLSGFFPLNLFPLIHVPIGAASSYAPCITPKIIQGRRHKGRNSEQAPVHTLTA